MEISHGAAASRRALQRAIACGALGPGCVVTAEDVTTRFWAPGRSGEPSGGRITLDEAGQADWALDIGSAERHRLLEAVLAAVAVSLGSTLWLGWWFFQSLPAGAVTGIAWAAARIVADRRRMRRQVGALLQNLALLVDAAGEEASEAGGLEPHPDRL